MFSANKGSACRKLLKLLLGGAFQINVGYKVHNSSVSKVNILVFDEIDTGVSGEIASLMGDMMLKISKENQLIAISHFTTNSI